MNNKAKLTKPQYSFFSLRKISVKLSQMIIDPQLYGINRTLKHALKKRIKSSIKE